MSSVSSTIKIFSFTMRWNLLIVRKDGLYRLFGIEFIAYSANIVNVGRPCRERLQLLAQIAEMDNDRTRIPVTFHSPNRGIQLFQRIDGPGVACEMDEQLKLFGHKRDRLAVQQHLKADRVDLETGVCNDVILGGGTRLPLAISAKDGGAPQVRVHPGDEHLGVERFTI